MDKIIGVDGTKIREKNRSKFEFYNLPILQLLSFDDVRIHQSPLYEIVFCLNLVKYKFVIVN
jgi:hypothetical protein